MKAVVFYEHGGPSVLRYAEVERLRPGWGMALVRVGATTLNRGLDLMVLAGSFGMGSLPLPHVGGSDAAGEVVELGPGVEGLEVGDRVLAYHLLACGRCDGCRSGRGENYCHHLEILGVHRWGGHAEYVALPARNLLPLPDNVPYAAAAALPVAYGTAWHGLVERAGVGRGDTVLVTAAGSGLGTAAIRICALRGARVFAVTGTAAKRRKALDIGADAVFDRTDPAWPDRVRDASDDHGVTVLFDNVGGPLWEQGLACLGHTGRLVCSGATADPLVRLDLRRLYRDQLTLYFSTGTSRSDVTTLIGLVSDGALVPVIDSSYPLAEAVAAYERLAAHRQFGKVVLSPDL